MYSKLCLLALAVAVRATPDAGPYHHHGHHHGHYHPSGGIFPPSGSVAGTVAPFPTGASSAAAGVFPTGTAAGSGAPASGPEPTGDSTLTYTITVEGHTSVITTTIHHTNYHTDFVYAKQSDAPAEKNVDQGAGSVTQTVHITSTSTHFITEYAGATGTAAAGAEEKNVQPGSGGCAAQSTVTVTGAEITVTVTAPAEGAANTGGAEEKGPQTEAGGATGTGEIPPYPIPSSKKHKTKCASTGFITKSAKGTGTGAVGPTGSGGLGPFPVASGTAPIEKVRRGKN